ncbi:MFS transporter [Yinghuangia seranimata]|uniref:MFS transporter n=1 Tax=Yinghuangia seranimata TaxID=408067 RepID=UPI00248B3604|nr:MFS transporter [Yinghuangia seranimata]MDI2129803.1 MFS transporter [Yinghuangia seranimata]
MSSPSAPVRPAARQRLVLCVLVLSQLLIWIDNTILGAAFETLADPRRGLGATPDQLQWASGAYTLVFATFIFTAGAIGDRIGHRNVLVAGMVVFGASSVWAAYPADADQLVAARAVMGLGGALIMPATMAILTLTFTGPARAGAFGVFSAASGMGIAAGPVLAGVLLGSFWWGSIFLVNVPVAAIAAVAALRLLPNHRSPDPRRFDVAGPLLSIAALGLLAYGLIRAGQVASWSRPDVWAPAALGLLLLAAFIRLELRLAAPSFDPRLFRDRTFAIGHVALALLFMALTASSFYFAFYMQGARGYTPLGAAMVGLPPAVGVMIGGPVANRLIQRVPLRIMGTVTLAVTTVTMGAAVWYGLDTPVPAVMVVGFVQGLAIGMTIAPITVTVMGGLPPERAGAGSAVNNTVRQGGSLLGVALGGTVMSIVYRDTIRPDLADAPAALRDKASTSAELARAAAAEAHRPDIVQAADHAFMHAMHTTSAFVAATVALAAVLMWTGLRRRGADHPAAQAADWPAQEAIAEPTQ